MRLWVLMVFVFLVFGPPAGAETVFNGTFSQGGLVIGQAPPGSRVSQDGRTVRVAADGTFLLAYGRDAKPESRIEIIGRDGGKSVRQFHVAARDWKIQAIDGLPSKKVTPPKMDWDRIKAEGALIKQVRKIDGAEPMFTSGFQWPVAGPISGVFGSQRILNGKPKNPHNGVDIAAPRGTPIGACADGVVALVHDDMFYTGKTVMLDHGHGLTSVYIHMDSLLVTEGQRLTKGQILGTVGSTGRATGPHLHWGVSLFATHVDPQLLVGEMP
ncbi:M23 family metallopeptidase [Magnetospira sp. QH-2]|uniref:M23 family metallopeptidase n=1 Tax=Magnetospira sp. (strain QH-2) TaxID=1288970 RepID=UPI0003E80C8F|nr:M23 family metallopeptidase [Magnetospira sp. QH-2]CCQ74888.1 putative peptidase M23B [Magnetospira sp. QH-2]